MGKLALLGTRGIPASHGGFETFAERLAPWLAERGWSVEVFCQDETGDGPEHWNGVDLHQIHTTQSGPLGSVLFDLQSTRRTAGNAPLVLTLGYNTAIFGLLHRLRGTVNIVNMDGLEWKRSKWSWPVRQWFRANERCAVAFADHLIADHPRIADRLGRLTKKNKITMIPYGADALNDRDPRVLDPLGVAPGAYFLSIARIEPENQILEIVRAFSARPRGVKLVVLGQLQPERHRYHKEVAAAASPEVVFPGAIFEKTIVESLRCHTICHVHGHQVGGTNPSLIEALGAGCPILAHRNEFNLWTAGDQQAFFSDEEDLVRRFDELLSGPRERFDEMSRAAIRQHEANFQWTPVLEQYEALLSRFLPAGGHEPG